MYSDKNIKDNIITEPDDTVSKDETINLEAIDLQDPKYKSMGAS